MATPLLIRGVGELVTNAPDLPGQLGLISGAAIALRDGTVVWAGAETDIPVELLQAETLDVEGRAVIPGFVDAHTHVVFAGDRSEEFSARIDGVSYEEILRAGGGIHSTVSATRAASTADLADESRRRVNRMLRSGTTTIEIKSGYGLTVADEVRMLEVAQSVAADTGIGIATTFLGAHVPDQGMSEDEYVDVVVNEMMPAVAPLAEFCDVFVDRGAFGIESARTIFEAAARHGMKARVHAEQLSHTGAAGLAAEFGAASADHLDHVTESDAAAMAAAGVTAVLLPGAALSMRVPQAPARLLWDAGVVTALATDCNPGTSYVESMAFVVALGSLEMGLTPAEALWAGTRGGGRSLGRGDLGALVPGAPADLIVLDAPTYRHIGYRPGTDLTWRVVKAGALVA